MNDRIFRGLSGPWRRTESGLFAARRFRGHFATNRIFGRTPENMVDVTISTGYDKLESIVEL